MSAVSFAAAGHFQFYISKYTRASCTAHHTSCLKLNFQTTNATYIFLFSQRDISTVCVCVCVILSFAWLDITDYRVWICCCCCCYFLFSFHFIWCFERWEGVAAGRTKWWKLRATLRTLNSTRAVHFIRVVAQSELALKN